MAMHEEIANDHVPLAYLLGRRASDYRLPSLHRPPPIKHSRSVSNLGGDGVHFRQRQEEAQALLKKVLAKESRLDLSRKTDVDTALEPPRMQISSADRRQRSVELERCIIEGQQDDSALDVVASTAMPVERDADQNGGHWERERYGDTHGYVPDDPSFVEVVGSHARIIRTESMRRVHEDSVRHRKLQLKARRHRMQDMQQWLGQQQSDLKAKQKDLGRCQRDEVKPSGTIKTSLVKQWQQQQQQELDHVKQVEEEADLKRHEHVQRMRRDADAARQARMAASEREKQVSTKVKGTGPSFASALRIDASGEDSEDAELVAHQQTFTSLVDLVPSSNDTAGKGMQDTLESQLRTRQRELFVRSHDRRVQLGGGFGSKPRQSVSTKAPTESRDEFAAEAHRVPLSKSKREMLGEWKATLAAHR